MTRKIVGFFKKDIVFTIALACAVASMLFVKPSIKYIEYFDFSVLCILFCLMSVVAGFRKCGLLTALSEKLLSSAKTVRQVAFMLMILCFFSSMLLTNDVALIAFIPLTLVTLQNIPPLKIIYIVVIETMAANLGSMLTPVGNPQNLYLYSYYSMNIGEFIRTVAPITVLSFVVLIVLLFFLKNEEISKAPQTNSTINKTSIIVYMALFLFCILTVLRVVDYRLCTAVTILVVFFYDKAIIKKVDYMLLGTFMAFFVLVGNLEQIPAISEIVSNSMQGKELWTTVLLSQVISNVPAVIMLSGFTDNVHALLLGGNIGGLGTLVASLASLISYKIYAKSENANPMIYLGVFTLLNAGVLFVLCLFVMIVV